MMSPEGNVELYRLLKNWNPLDLELAGRDAFDFDAEIYDSMDVLFKYEGNMEKAGFGIQDIFHFSFEETIPMDRIRPIVMEAFKIIELYKEP
ncbi:DUF1871 family protein [Salinicoccus halodurans]|nr:DUF1871 family protein [Salinicoccus halodurans]